MKLHILRVIHAFHFDRRVNGVYYVSTRKLFYLPKLDIDVGCYWQIVAIALRNNPIR